MKISYLGTIEYLIGFLNRWKVRTSNRGLHPTTECRDFSVKSQKLSKELAR
jgi:hypothetical protein